MNNVLVVLTVLVSCCGVAVAIWSILTSIRLCSDDGEMLDDWGRVYGVKREEGETNEQFEERIKARLAANPAQTAAVARKLREWQATSLVDVVTPEQIDHAVEGSKFLHANQGGEWLYIPTQDTWYEPESGSQLRGDTVRRLMAHEKH